MSNTIRAKSDWEPGPGGDAKSAQDERSSTRAGWSPETQQDLLVEVRAGAVWVVLNRPGTLNAISTSMKHELLEAIEWAEALPEARAIVLTGAGKAFCSGADLTELRTTGSMSPSESVARVSLTQKLVRRLQDSPLVVVSAVNGVAAGGGVSLALCADIVCVSTESSFKFLFGKLGLVPDAGLGEILTSAIGRRRALSLALLGSELSPQDVSQMGLADLVLAPNELGNGVDKVLGGISELPADTAMLTKSMFSRSGNQADALESISQTVALISKQSGVTTTKENER